MEKDQEVQDVYNLPKVKKFIDRKMRNSEKTGKSYLSALVKLNRYTKKEHNQNVDNIIDALLTSKVNVYDVLDGYISFLPAIKEGITANTIGSYVAALKSYFSSYDIDVVPAKFKHKVSLPRKNNEKEKPIDASDIRKILLSCSNRRLKAYVLVLCSSGMRADTEACSIRNCDIDFTSQPVTIHIRADYTKTRVARNVYITDEAAYHLKQWNQFKGRSEPEELIFSAYQNDIPRTVKDTKRIANNIYFRLTVEFAKLLKVVDMDQRKETGIAEKRRHLVTFHSLRRFTYSIINNQTNTAFSEYFLGHSDSVYHNEKESVIKEMYLNKCMTALTILDYGTFEETGRSIESRLQQKEQEITVLRMKEKQHDEEMTRQKVELEEIKRKLERNDAILAEVARSNNRVYEHDDYDIPKDIDERMQLLREVKAGKIVPKPIGKRYTLIKPRNPARLLEAFKQDPTAFEKVYKPLYEGFMKELEAAKKNKDQRKILELSGEIEHLSEMLSLIQKAKSK